MAYAILVSAGRPGIVSYTLGGSESFEVRAATWQVSTNSGATPYYFFDYRDPQGGIIALQCAGQVDLGMPTLVSLAPNNPPAASIDINRITLFPGNVSWPNNLLIAPIMEPVALTPGCTVNAYVSPLDRLASTPDPLASLDTVADPHDLHLWVEDTKAIGDGHSQDLLVPYMLVPGPLAAA